MSLTSDILLGMKSVKYLSWEKTFIDKLFRSRATEFESLKKFKVLYGFMELFWENESTILTLVIFATYVYTGQS